jgi:hypothetical protein
MDSPLADPAEWTLLTMQCCELIAATALGKAAASWALFGELGIGWVVTLRVAQSPSAQGCEAGV